MNVKNLLELYPLSDARITSMIGDENVHTTWRLSDKAGDYILKRYTFPPDAQQTEKLNLSCRLMAHLYARNFPCPKPIQTCDS